MKADSLVLGLGLSGVAAASYLLERGESLILTDQRGSEALEASPLWGTLQSLNDRFSDRIEWELGGHPTSLLTRCRRVVVSPGVSLHNDFLVEARRLGCELVGEMELAWEASPRPLVAVTGTNGKSTTCSALGEILGVHGLVGGNIGKPLLDQVRNVSDEVEWIVAEVSSFQLETVHQFHPRIALLTNLTPDHLDHHLDLEEYRSAKSRMFAQMNDQDTAIFCLDDPGALEICAMVAEMRLPNWLDGFPEPNRSSVPKILSYSTRQSVENGVAFISQGQDRWVASFLDGQHRPMFVWNFPGFPGEAMESNALAAICAALEIGVSDSKIEAALRRFQPLHYRMERSGEINGVTFINDSKATNIASALSSVRAVSGPLCVIVGGKDKGVDYSAFAQGLADSGSRIFLIGEASTPIASCLRRIGYKKFEESVELDRALPDAYKNLGSEGTVLLAPACSSFDQFESAEHRGREFDRLVGDLIANQRGQLRCKGDVVK